MKINGENRIGEKAIGTVRMENEKKRQREECEIKAMGKKIKGKITGKREWEKERNSIME